MGVVHQVKSKRFTGKKRLGLFEVGTAQKGGRELLSFVFTCVSLTLVENLRSDTIFQVSKVSLGCV